MRLKSLLLVGSLLLSTLTFAQTTASRASNGKKVLKGKIDMQTLMNDSAFAWFYTGVNGYQPNDNMLNYIKDNRGKFNIVAVVGTWEDQSRQLLPQLYKIMILGGSPDEQVQTYGADEKMQTSTPQDYKVKKLPTFIVLREGKEIGRLNGEVGESLESDIARILLKANRKDKD
ncbi:Thiol-disulfide isomerase or thioredoxin [Chitinophaga sp. YR627]|uniref:thioredoxin family protein n=1 Tax=Chitinophaga sp. YR627 TaxID=1881041 RepID=UPI0008E4CA12|nr:thioredoxin family protein [Chitinophaga sp. YR627]SFN70322.1 Thiol-disulfide isomerase or thioredoxin [Chitinophaga sp. YR627]